MTLDDISGGRIIVGVGAGGTGWDATVLGQQPLTPGSGSTRLAEFVDAHRPAADGSPKPAGTASISRPSGPG